MPQIIIPAVIAGLASGSWVIAGAASVFNMAAFGTTLVLGGLSRLMAPKAKSGAVGAATVSYSGVAQAVKQPIVTREIVYGELRTSGGIVYMGSTAGNQYLHMVVALAPHQINEIGEVWLDDYSIPSDHLDGSGMVTEGRYAGLVRIKKHLGYQGQVADSDMVSEITDWTTDHKLSGIAYIYLRLEWDADAFPNGIPNPSAWVRGASVLDTRDSVSRFSMNIALFCNDYLRSDTYGFGAAEAEICETALNASANICDEFVTTPNEDTVVDSIATATDIITLDADALIYQRGDKVRLLTTDTAPAGLAVDTDYFLVPYQRMTVPRILLAASYADALAGVGIDITDSGAGTHTIRKIAEPRYAGAIKVDTAGAIGENVKDILSGMGGQTVYSGGIYIIQAASYQTPTVYFDESDMIGPVNCATKISRRERFNTVMGNYINPIFNGQAVDYPKITNSTYVTQDGGYEIIKKIDYPATQRAGTCQRLAKIQLEKMRQEITWSCEFNLSAFQVKAGDTAFFTFEKLGWDEKIFEIVSWELGSKMDENSILTPFITMGLRETASGVFDWGSGEETQVDLAPNTMLPDPFTVGGLTGLSVDSERVLTAAGDYVFKMMLQWDLHSNYFVTHGGIVEISFKKTDDAVWRPTYRVPGDSVFAEVSLAATLNIQYDLRVRPVNSIGVHGTYTSLLNYTVGSSGGVGATQDLGDWVEAIGDYEDAGNWTDAIGATEDDGYFT